MIHHIVRNQFWQCLFIFTLLFTFNVTTQAAVPDNVDYQGYLTNSGGSPINGTVSVTFSLYNIDTGGISLWTDTQAVTLTNGLFDVKLGSAGNPFPLGLFDAPLWLGIDVASDGEMAPRIAFSSAAFAHKADDADSVGGISAGNLVQSSDLATHTSNASAHHSKTTSFTELSDQASDAQIPANITRDSELTTHTGNASAHHPRYTNGEAVTAMGAKEDANPLHHDKRTDTQVFAAVTTQDGAGSTLDADLVDGLEASEIIDAASDEVRTPISSLPFTINASGSYYVTGNLDGASGGIDITADNVTLDLMGFTLDGGGTVADYGIDFYARNNVTIKNGTVRGFGYAGIYQGWFLNVHHVTLMDVKVLSSGTLGTTDVYTGIYLRSTNSHIERCTAGDNGGHGIFTAEKSKLINNTAYGNTGDGIIADMNSTLRGNTAYNNTGDGIGGGSGSNLSGNIAYNNTGIGIYGETGAILRGNIAWGNSTGIQSEQGANVSGNTAYANAHWGIYARSSNTIQDNTIYNNNTSNTANEGGLRVDSNSRIMGNTLDSNNQNNIFVSSSGNALIENHVTDSINGINFVAAGNYYRNNTASGNTTNYVGSLPTGGGDGGGNASF